MRTIEEEAEIIYGKRKPNAEDTRMALVKEKKRIECAKKDIIKSKGLNQIQVDLLSSFLVGHWKEISKSEYRVAFERILETLNPGALQAVKNLQKVM